MRVSPTTKAASPRGAGAVVCALVCALACGGLLFADTARAEEGRTFDCRLVHLFGDGSMEGHECGEPTTYDGPGTIRVLNGAGGWACRTISVRPDPEKGGASSFLKATGCTSAQASY
ncbi:hypothetical protein [Streptomyces sp. NPDC006285]|uniref:hypothetical protein n=1 Tax=Streptomyces sp. NPDC006285 TaxID=3364742 RepID=UPI0036CD6194